MNRPIPIPAHHPSPLMPERGGHVTLPHVAAASSALSRHGLPGAATFSPASVGEPFHLHPGGVAVIRGSGPASPMRPNGVGFNREASGLAANGNTASGTPFVMDCLSRPRRGVVHGVGATGGGV